MRFNGIYNQTIEFRLEYHNLEELTGIKEESDYRILHLEIEEVGMCMSFLISDVKKIIEWFEGILLNKPIEPRLLTSYNQLYFDLLKNNLSSKIIRITYDDTTPVPGFGAYSLGPGIKKEDVFKKRSLKCEMDNIELQKIVKELRIELTESGKK